MKIDRLLQNAVVLAALAPMTALCAPALAETSDGEASAESAEQPAESLAEITVTANRRAERLHDVPVSVGAATGDTLKDMNIQRPEELVRLFTGFTSIPNAGSAAVSYNIRGVGQSDFAEHEEQPVTAYQDGVYVSNSASTGFPLFDIQRVELLRGPQGTLFGRNSTGGLVQFFSNQPLAGTNGYLEATAGDYNLHRVEGAFNYGTETLAVRLAGYFSDRDGFVKNTLGENLLAERIGAARLQVRYSPNDYTTATLRLEGFSTYGTSQNKATPSAVGPNGIPYLIPANVNAYGTGPGKDLYGFRDVADPYVQSVNDPGLIEKRPRTAALTIQQKINDQLTAYSITSYNRATERYREDTDGTPNNVFYYNDSTRVHTASEELRIQAEMTKFRATAGVYGLNIDGAYTLVNGVPTICDPTNTVTCAYAGTLPLDAVNGKGAEAGSLYSLQTRSFAVFSQGEYDFTDQLTLVVGARFTWDRQHYHYQWYCTQTETGACNAIFGPGIATSLKNVGPGPFALSQSYGLPSGKVGLNYKISPEILTYISLNRGVKGAGYIFSYDGTLPLNQLSFRPEKLTSIEGGVKSELFSHRLTANLAVFHYDYKDFQTFQFSGVSATVVNKDAYANGGELEFALHPGNGISANLGVAYDSFWVKNIPTFNGVVENQRPINAPVWQLNWGLSKEFRLPGEATLSVGYNGRYTGERWFNIINEEVVRSPGDIVHGMDLSISTNNGLTYKAYVTNLTNVAVANARFDQTAQGFVLTHWSPPRMFGASIAYRY